MKKILSFVFASSLLLNSVFAQKGKEFEGKVIYDISYPGMELDANMAAMLPKETTIYIKGDRSRTEMSMGMGMSNVTISDGKEKKVTSLMDIMGSKYAIAMTEADLKKEQDKENGKAKVKFLDETKEIAGYKCKKAEVSFDNKEKTVATVYYTPEIANKNLNWSKNEFSDIDGFLMEFETVQSGMTMKMVAKSVNPQTVEDSKFLIPADYKPTTQEELKKMFGQ